MGRSSASGHAMRKFEFQHDDTLSKLKNTRRFFIYQYISARRGFAQEVAGLRSSARRTAN